MRWTKKDQSYVRQVIDFIASNTDGGLSGFARDLGASRQVVGNWRARGKIPPKMHGIVIELAQKAVARAKDDAAFIGNVTQTMLHPLSREIIEAHERSA